MQRLYLIDFITLDDLSLAADQLRCTVLLSGRHDGTLGVLVTMDADDTDRWAVNNFAEFEDWLTLRNVRWRIATT